MVNKICKMEVAVIKTAKSQKSDEIYLNSIYSRDLSNSRMMRCNKFVGF